MNRTAALTGLLVALLALQACAHTMIEGTSIRDTEDNRALLEVLIQIRAAFEARDTDGILTHVSTLYFEDGGTPDPKDDYGYKQLKETILPESLAVTEEAYLTFQVHDVAVDGDLAFADIRYASRTRLEMPTGSLWDSHREFNRVEFKREEGAWRILKGL